MKKARKLPAAFYRDDDVIDLSRKLLGKVLHTRIDDTHTGVVITETEAYAGIGDRASHAFGGRRTKRTEPMYALGGIAYVYLCYGIHHLFNVVTGPSDAPFAVLVRAGTAFLGEAAMATRRGRAADDPALLAGPGSLSKALGITTALTGVSLSSDSVWIEDHAIDVPESAIQIGPRVGVDYAGEDAARPYRFRVTPASITK